MMGRFNRILGSLNPRNGYIIASDGDQWNLADWHRMQERYSPLYQAVENGAVRMTGRERDVDDDVHYIGLDVPDGREFVLFYRELKLTENDYDIDVVKASGGFSGGTIGYKSTLRAGATETVQSDLYMGVEPSGDITVLDADFLDVGTEPGGSRVQGASGVEDVMVTLKGKSMIRITRRTGTNTYTVGIRLIAWEQDIE